MVQVPNGAPSSAASAGRTKAQSPAVTPQAPHSTRAKNVPSVAAMANQPLSARRAEPLDLNSVERKGKQADGLLVSSQRQHINGVTEAPTFRPTEEEWREPMEYMQKIAAEGMQYGIIKIKPPDSWNPDFAVDTTRFHFRTRKQELNSVEGGTRANLNYLDQLTMFHKQNGMSLTRFPSVDKKPLDLYELKKSVESRGGFERVCKGKKWAEIGRDLGYSGKIMSSLSTSLKNSYTKWLEPYERWLRGAKPGVQMQLEQERGGPYATPSPGTSPIRKPDQHTPSSLSHDSSVQKASQSLNAALDDGAFPAKPVTKSEQVLQAPFSGGFTPVNAGGFTAINAPATPSGFTAVNTSNGTSSEQDRMSQERSSAVRTEKSVTAIPPFTPTESASSKRGRSEVAEPQDGQESSEGARRSKRAKKEPAPTVTGSHMQQPRSSTPRLFAARDRNNEKPGDVCENCGKGNDEKRMLICESCYNGFHTYCLDPPLKSVPENDWHCPKCLVGTGEFGFEEGGIYSLKQFQDRAYYFKEAHFATKLGNDPITQAPRGITEDDVETEFWRLVTSLTETVEVEYGADIHSTTHGSGFPTIEQNPRNSYSTDPWNLNNLPLSQDSLFRYIKSDISGMTVPWLYVGMIFSTFCWHNEDHYTYSANYQHFGATKTWYGIPGEDATRFEDAMREAVPELFETQPDLLFQLVTLLGPEQLRKNGVRVYAVDQRAGEFVITYPQAYHAGFNHGFNFNEAVNFAPADWEPYGQAGVERLRDFRRQPCFSHDELLMTAASAKDVSIKTAKWLAPALQNMLEKELQNRRNFEENMVRGGDVVVFNTGGTTGQLLFRRETDNQDLNDDDYVCSYCKGYAYLSRFVCEESKKIACLDHIASIQPCCSNPENHVMHVRMTDGRLEQTVQKIVDKARMPEAWIAKFEAAITGVPKPQLKIVKSLLAEGERVPWDMPEVSNLKRFVDRCSDWIEEANYYITRKQQNRRKSEKGWRKGSTAKLAEMQERDREVRKLSNIRKLLIEADRIGFECQEITQLQERADSIAEFQADAKAALATLTTRTTQQIEDLVEIGRSFPVDIPEVEQLDKIVRQMKWKDKASERGVPRTLQDVDELLSQAVELNVPEHNEHLLYLRDRKQKGELWELKAKELMSVEQVNFAQLDSFSRQAQDLPVSRDTLASIDAILRKQREAQDQIKSLYERCRESDFRKRPFYKEVVTVMEALGELNSKPAGTVDLEKEQKRHEDWMRRGKKLFGKSNAPLHILLQHMKIVDQRNRGCFSLTDKPRMPVEPSSREHTPEALQDGGVSSENIFCLCRTPEAGLMIECTVCHEWYHSKCLKIARGKYKEDEDYTCPICDWRVKIPRDAARPKLEDLTAWQSEIPQLPFQPDEEECLSSIIDTAQDFRNFVRPYVNPDNFVNTHEEVPTQRFYLRKIEGADILLTHETNFLRQELYRFVPIAPEPPPILEASLSTRKPRPTKQQKLMAQLGVESPEDLPQNLRTKPYNVNKRKAQDEAHAARVAQQHASLQTPGSDNRISPSLHRNSSSSTGMDHGGSNGQSQSRGGARAPPQLNFRPPLTQTAFPVHRQHHSHGPQPESPLFSSSITNHYSTTPNVTLPRLGSPFGTTLDPDSPHHRESTMDNGMFSTTGMNAFADDGRSDDKLTRISSHVEDHNDDTHDDREMFGSAGMDSIFAEMTNDDDETQDGPGGGVDQTMLSSGGNRASEELFTNGP